MKILLIFLTTSYFLSFTNTSHANSTHNKTVFTITHKADNDEPVVILLYTEDNTAKPRKMFPEECLNVTHDQFPYLTIMAGIDGDEGFKILCNAQYTKHNCQPQHYNIIDEGIIFDDYIIRATEQPNTDTNCTDIAQWIEGEKTEPVFTITHKASHLEDVYISQRNTEGIKTPQHILHLKECLKVKESQFDNLIIEVSDSSGIFGFTQDVTENKVLCSDSKENKCSPNNYSIMDVGFFSDNFIIEDFTYPNNDSNCIEIDQWMNKQEHAFKISPL